VADLLEQGSRWLEDQRTKHCTRELTYVRGAASTVVKATVGRTEYETDDGTAVRIAFTERDFLILAADLNLGSGPTLPVRGDTIREPQDGTVYEFEVLDWRWSDLYRQTFRIETKLIDTEAASPLRGA
jgi:hypothetical protein